MNRGGTAIRLIVGTDVSAHQAIHTVAPYTVAGRRLYQYSEVDHEHLFCIASAMRGDFLMTYDEAQPIRDLAEQFGFDTHTVLMKNTHHRVMPELLIGRNLAWARA